MTDENKNKKKKKWYKRWLLFIFLFFFIILSSIGITLYLIPRVEFLQRGLAQQIVKFLNNELQGQLELDKIIFHNYNELELRNARLLVAGDTLASIPKLELKFRFRNLLNKNISVRYLTLHNPTIKMLRLKDGSWNYEHITKLSEEVDTSISKSPPISFRKFEIKGGKFVMFDSSNVDTSYIDGQLNFSDMNVSNINLICSGKILLDDNNHNYSISKLELKENNSGLTLNHSFINEIGLRDKKTYIKQAQFNIDSSEINLNMTADNYSVLNSDFGDMEKMKMQLEIKGKNVKSDLMNYFTEPILKSNENYDLSIFANGNLNRLLVNEFNLTGNGISMKGDLTLKNILEPDSLRYFANFKNSNINLSYYKDKFMFDLEDLPELGLTYFNEFDIEGGIFDYHSNFDLRTNLGDLKGYAKLDINDVPEYDLLVDFKNLNLDKIVSGNQISKLNGYLKIKGTEFDPALMTGEIELKLYESKYIQDKIDTLHFTSDINKGKLSINEFSLYKGVSKATISGYVDISDFDNLMYDITIKSSKLDLSKINENFPDKISADISIKGRGIDFENMQLEIDANLRDFSIFDKHILKYNFNLIVDNDDNADKYMKVTSNEIDFELIGNFILDDLIDLINYEIAYFENNFNQTYSGIIGEEFINEMNYLKKYPNIDLTFNTSIKNLHKFNEILDMNINTKGNINMNLISNQDKLKFQINNFDLNHTYIEIDEDPLSSKRIDMNFLYRKSIIDEIEQIDTLSFNIFSPNLVYSENKLDSLEFNVDYYLHHLNLSFLSKINDDIKIDTDMVIDEKDNIYDFRFPKMKLSIDKLFDFHNQDDLKLSLNNSNLIFNKFSLTNNLKEEVNINGAFNIHDEYFDNLNLNLGNYDLSHLIDVFEMDEYFSTFKGMVKNMNVNLNGYMFEPRLDLNIKGRNLEFNRINLGNLDIDFKYLNHNIDGSFKIGKNDASMKIDILQLPFNFNLKDLDVSLVEDQDLKVVFSLNQLDAGVIEPFSPGILDIKGRLNSKVEVIGNKRDGVTYSGNLRLNDGSFLVEATNIIYNTDALVNIQNDKFEILETSIRNRSADLKGGRANIDGFIQMKGFDVDNFEFTIKSNRLKVMRDETRYSMPDFFGDFIIATGEKPLVFSGNFDEPNISGDVDVLEAKLQMPNEMTAQIVESKLHYEFLDDVIRISLKDSNEIGIAQQRIVEKPFLDLLNYDLNIRFLGDFSIKLDIDALTQMRINLGTKYKTDVVNYRKDREEEEAVLLGEIILKDNSSMSFFGKKFETTGIVMFPTGEIANPQFDIKARYKNFTQTGIPFEVQILVSGYKDNPQIKFFYIYNNFEATGDQSEIDQNAFSLLTLNMLKQDALGDNSQNSNIQGEMVNYGNSFISSIASKSLNEALLEYGLVTDIDLDLNNPDQSMVKIQGKLFKNIKWTVGGNVSNIENNQVSIEVPLGVFYGIMTNLQFTKPNNPFVTQENQILWETKLRFGKTW